MYWQYRRYREILPLLEKKKKRHNSTLWVWLGGILSPEFVSSEKGVEAFTWAV